MVRHPPRHGCRRSDTPRDAGLSSIEARRRLAEFGPNELAAGLHVGALRRVARSVLSPLMLILLAASAVAAWAGEVIDASIIAVTVALSILLDAVQTARSTGAAERLRQSVVPSVAVRRDGAWIDVPRPAVVPGDLIRLGAGTLVPADARLMESRDLHVHEAALTGESLPAEKESAADGLPWHVDRPLAPRPDSSPPPVVARRIRRHRRAAARGATGDGVRARTARPEPPARRDRDLPRVLPAPRQRRAASRPAGVAALRRRAGRRDHPRVHADDHDAHPRERRRAHGAAARDREAPRRHPELSAASTSCAATRRARSPRDA